MSHTSWVIRKGRDLIVQPLVEHLSVHPYQCPTGFGSLTFVWSDINSKPFQWSFLDVTFSSVFGIYLVLRIHGWRTGDLEPGQQALDVLAMGAPLLVPRLAFNLMSENMLFVSLRAMLKDFTILTGLA
jgi:hypothetical protein